MIRFVISTVHFQMYNIEHNKIVSTSDTCTEIYGGCDFAVDCLIIGTKTPLLHVSSRTVNLKKMRKGTPFAAV